MKKLVEFESYSLTFATLSGKIKVLENVSFSINHNEVFALVGETGCGKTVTAISILNLLPVNAIRSGRIFFNGTEIDDKTVELIRGRDVAMIFQDPTSSLNPLYTVEKQLMDILVTRQHMSKKEAGLKMPELLKQVQLYDVDRILKSYPHELSGGMRQRIMIAMALACKPKLLIADEPTTALDVTVQRQILYLIAQIKEKNQLSILFITHDMGIVAQIADRVGVMYAGMMVEIAPKKTIFEKPLHPYTAGLMSCIFNPKKKTRPKPIAGSVPSFNSFSNECRFHSRCGISRKICSEISPELVEIEPGHLVACHACGGVRDD
ncbi:MULTISPECIES: ABC transporter ATP-binding protein [Pseudothermotoga]|uniref:Oligopeptide/dipeptide ABC transporter, ATPase subunit n=1 Tax=Pseudothermotoga lettingae (strain ATCC BAA-301 / DSM 14385 / NBRC 107922 / TMO) TaxID=416591 RepID=A8F7C6_PSELT|nr:MULTISPECIES: ABC transporter ATP-binding protein [Pseudothermotoga]ABV34060.1 oligopeptide/dipeptide ABC transporter, ATPase subunit [Pseudothermotoga lettingae TMO]MDI3494695.1 peptide/nickel transport system ATP-binding protein [Pseudothermotoga sp.]GLI49001.1 peptide ABC transporter ATP-binding protein [Pseudothermotoga lettingae TMO]HBJ81079.1 ABC transporter ATP-binding protein [Pseudothermotoga sp.]